MKTNRFINIKVALFIAVSALMAACTIEDANMNAEPKGEQLDIASNIDVSPTTTSVEFDVKSDVSWTVTADNSWDGFSVSPTSGSGNATVKVTTGENTTRKDRSTTLTVKTAGGIQQDIVVRQIQSEPILEVSSGSGQSLEYEAIPEGSKSITISCNTSWELTSDNWITCSKTEGTNESLTATNVSVEVTEAQTDTIRTGTIRVIAEGGRTGEIKVSQKGKVIELYVSAENFNVKATGEEKTFQISCNADWRLEYDNELFLCNTMQGTGDANVTVTCLPNNRNESRTSVLSVKSGIYDIKEYKINFVQEAATPPVLSEFEIIESSIKKNQATFKLKFNTMFPLSEYGVYYSKNSSLSNPTKASVEETVSGANEVEFTLTGLESMTTYYVYGYIHNSVGDSDTKGRIELSFTTAGVKPSDDDNPTPNLSRRKK